MVRLSAGLYIGGDWRTGDGDDLLSLDPSTSRTAWAGKTASAADVRDAVAAAREAYKDWAKVDVDERARVLERFAEILGGDAGEELAACISTDTGKPRWEARTEVAAVRGKVAASIQGQARKSTPPLTTATSIVETQYVPLGVFAVLGPFNFPAHMSNGHIIPALLAGNTVVLKPSPLAPLTAEMYVALLARAGLPAGVINLLHGGAEVASALINLDVDAVCLTGSYEAGRAIHSQLAGRPEVLLVLELGGNSPIVVWSYDDLDAAVAVVVQSSFISAGQRCNSARRLIVRSAIADEFLLRLSEVSGSLVIGSPDDEPEPFMGPLISDSARQAYLSAVEDIIREGARVHLPSRPLDRPGYFVTPGIIEPDWEIKDEEIFGPLIQVSRQDTLDQAIVEADRTKFGLAAGLISANKEDFELFRARVRAGLLNWNTQLTGASGLAPFGGVKLSGNHHPAGILSADYAADGIAVSMAEAPAVPVQLPPGLRL